MTKTEFITRWLLQNADNDYPDDQTIRNVIREAVVAYDYLMGVFVRNHSPYIEPSMMQPFDFAAEWVLRNSDNEALDIEHLMKQVKQALAAYQMLTEECRRL